MARAGSTRANSDGALWSFHLWIYFFGVPRRRDAHGGFSDPVAATCHHRLLCLGRLHRNGGCDTPYRPPQPGRNYQAAERSQPYIPGSIQSYNHTAGRLIDAGVRYPEFHQRSRQLSGALAHSACDLYRERAGVGCADRAVLHRAIGQWLEQRLRGAGGHGRFCGDREMSNGSILLLMKACFLGFGYMGVPVAFALMAGVLAACGLTPISMQSMIGQMFHGIDSEILLAVPFFLLVGELMTSADVTNRMIRLAQTMVGHLRGGLAQVVTLFSMFFAGISGS